MESTFPCVICNRQMLEFDKITKCTYCGKNEEAEYLCSEGHYVCEECRLDSPVNIIRKTCRVTRETDPAKIAVLLMKHTAMPMSGPEHHVLMGCVLLAALRNSGNFEIPDTAFEEVIKRAQLIPFGSCGLLGTCGAAVGAGIAVSVATKTSIMSDRERSLCLLIVSRALERIAKIGGPRCCKASVFASIEVVTELLQECLEIKLPKLETIQPCQFAEANRNECLRDRCLYFK